MITIQGKHLISKSNRAFLTCGCKRARPLFGSNVHHQNASHFSSGRSARDDKPSPNAVTNRISKDSKSKQSSNQIRKDKAKLIQSDPSTITKCNEIMVKFLTRRNVECKPPSIAWLHQQQEDDNHSDFSIGKYSNNEALYKDVLILIDALELAVKAKRISATSGRENQELTAILGNILLICSETPPVRLTKSGLPKTSDACMRTIGLIKALNFDVQSVHLKFTVRAANQEHDWKLASSLFRQQIDPDINGYMPIDSKLGPTEFLEMGLYAVAMDSGGATTDEEESFKVVQGVFHAAQEMSIVSPTDLEKYVLAAGSALGRAGQWKGCRSFLENSTTESLAEFGTAIYAAILNACYKCGKYDDVLEIYKNLLEQNSTHGRDWQWQGEYSSIHPLCDDLMLRSLGKERPEGTLEGFSEFATLMFERIVQQGGRISRDAILGVLKVCANDHDYHRALSVYHKVQGYRGDNGDWQIIDHEEQDFLLESNEQSFEDDILSATMEACNQASQYGLSMLCYLQSSGILFREDICDLDEMDMTEHLKECMPDLYSKRSVFDNLSFALNGLNCSHEAQKLANIVSSSQSSSLDETSSNVAWKQSYKHMFRLLVATHRICKDEVALTKEDVYNLSLATAKMLRCTNASQQSSAGIYVYEKVLDVVQMNCESQKSFKDSFKSFLGFDDIDQSERGKNQFLLTSDELLSGMIETEHNIGLSDTSLNMFMSLFDDNDTLPKDMTDQHTRLQWTLSSNEAMKVFLEQNRNHEVRRVFDRMQATERNSDSFLLVVASLVNLHKWEDIIEIYDLAVTSDDISEELSVITMKAVTQSGMHDKLRILRGLVHDIAKLRNYKVGMKSTSWVAEHYWDIKQQIGFHFARLLMSWNDRNTAQFNEVRLACQHFLSKRQQDQVTRFDAIKSIIMYLQKSENDFVSMINSIPQMNQLDPCIFVTWIMVEVAKKTSDDEDEVCDTLNTCLRYLSQRSVEKERQVFADLLEREMNLECSELQLAIKKLVSDGIIEEIRINNDR